MTTPVIDWPAATPGPGKSKDEREAGFGKEMLEILERGYRLEVREVRLGWTW